MQVDAEPIGDTLDLLRATLEPWLGEPRRVFKEGRVNLLFRFDSEGPPIVPLRLKIEINTREHFTECGLVTMPFEVKSRWFQKPPRPDFEGHRDEAALGEVLAGVDLDFEPQGHDRRTLGVEAEQQVDSPLLEDPSWLSEPRLESGPEQIQGVPDGPGIHLHEIDVLGVPYCGLQMELVERGSTPPREAARHGVDSEYLHDRPADDEVLLDLLVRGPGASPRHSVM